MIYNWHPSLPPRGLAFNPRGMTVSGPVSLGGQIQVASVDSGYWVATYSRVAVGGLEKVKAFRSLRALLEGGAHQVRVPVYDRVYAPWVSAADMSAVLTTHDDDTTFDDNSSYSQPRIGVVATEAADLGDTLLVVDVLSAGDIEGGEYFSIGDRLYVIKQIVAESGAQLSLAIWPPLREDVADGSEINFDRPVCRMRLMTEREMDVLLDLGRVGFADVGFVEIV